MKFSQQRLKIAIAGDRFLTLYLILFAFSMAVIYLQAFVFVVLFGKIMRKVFFGRLRAAEFEHLMERSWYAVTETCLAFTVFK